MLNQYLEAALQNARFETTEHGRIFGTISGAPGVWAEADDLDRCREELREVLEEWLILSLRRGESLPVFGQCDLNHVAQHG